jgi:hypothetical protein
MADRKVYCGGCSLYVGKLAEGSTVMVGIVYLCPTCEIKRKASDLASKTSPKPDYMSMFDDIFKGKK